MAADRDSSFDLSQIEDEIDRQLVERLLTRWHRMLERDPDQRVRPRRPRAPTHRRAPVTATPRKPKAVYCYWDDCFDEAVKGSVYCKAHREQAHREAMQRAIQRTQRKETTNANSS